MKRPLNSTAYRLYSSISRPKSAAGRWRVSGAAAVRQRGITLVVGLVFLLVMTLLGVNALSTTVLEQRMAGNLQQRTLAFQTAEAAVARFFNGADQSQAPVALSEDNACGDADTVANNDLNQGVENEACVEYLAITGIPRMTDVAFDTSHSAVHFRIASASRTAGHANVTVNQGMFRVGPGGPSVLRESR